MAIREFLCPVHGKFEKYMPMSELPDSMPCPASEPNDTDALAVDGHPATCGRESGRCLSVPGLIII